MMTKHSVPKISETEWEVMRVVWEQSPISASAILERLMAKDPTWHPKTAKTLLARLVKKGALEYEASGRAYQYRPLVTENECVRSEGRSFVERVFGGALKPMLAHFVEEAELGPDEIRELESLLRKKRSKK